MREVVLKMLGGTDHRVELVAAPKSEKYVELAFEIGGGFGDVARNEEQLKAAGLARCVEASDQSALEIIVECVNKNRYANFLVGQTNFLLLQSVG